MSRHRSRAANKLWRWLEILLLLGGLAGLGVWGWSHVRMAIFQHEANHALDRKIASRPAIPAPLRVPPPDNGALLGRLVIQRLNLRAVVREGTDHDTLDVAVGHIPGTALPGQPGNVGVAGHRDTLFRGLRHIEKNDIITFQTPQATYRYEVESTGIVTPKDVGVLGPGQHPEMTMVTCYPFNFVGSAPDRFVVKARLIGPSAPVETAPVKTAVVKTEPVKTTPVKTTPAEKTDPPRHAAARRVDFHLTPSDTQELAPGILMNLSWTDVTRRRANGWVWVAQDRHTIWLRKMTVRQPLLFQHRELILTSIASNSVSGYLLLP
ncbi:MAG TPA: class D sortase [Bryobacteraceae bacterium]|nr:class D sortase [Bryobacteraceae bacterium]